jgi:hypothetical protein
MNLSKIEVNAADVARGQMLTVEIDVKNMRWMRFRMWLGTRFITFGGWVVGFNRCTIIMTPALACRCHNGPRGEAILDPKCAIHFPPGSK